MHPYTEEKEIARDLQRLDVAGKKADKASENYDKAVKAGNKQRIQQAEEELLNAVNEHMEIIQEIEEKKKRRPGVG